MHKPLILPAITLYQPWATWVMRGWKPIETRTHNRFACLVDRSILIHAGMRTDAEAINNPYLTREQILHNPAEIINGYILGKATVQAFGKLGAEHSNAALINCGSTTRYGLFLTNVEKFETPILAKGEMGIWYYDVEGRHKAKVPKPAKNILNQLF